MGTLMHCRLLLLALAAFAIPAAAQNVKITSLGTQTG